MAAYSSVLISNSKETQNLLKTLELVLEDTLPIKGNKNDSKKYEWYTRKWTFRKNRIGKDGPNYVKSCIVSHRFKEAAKLLGVMCQENTSDHNFLYKGSMLVLEKLQDDISHEQFLQFVRNIKRFKKVNKFEVILEYLMYGLRNEVPDIQGTFQDFMLMKYKSSLRKNETIETLIKAYTGIFDYIEWCKSNTDDSQATYGENAAEKAIHCFRECLKVPGQWDIFIIKLVQILEFYGRLDEVKTDLVKYIEVNPTHINGYIYLCTFLNKYYPDSEMLITHLKELVKLSPSDPSVLLLIDKWKNDGKKTRKMLKLLFRFLDYPANGENIQAWNCLSELLKHISEKWDSEKPVFKTMHICWRHRAITWPAIHFDTRKLELLTEDHCELAMYKSLVLARFSYDHAFIAAVSSQLPAISEGMFANLITELDLITDQKKSLNLCIAVQN